MKQEKEGDRQKMEDTQQAHLKQRTTYLTLTGTFLALFAAFSLVQRKQEHETALRPFDLLLLGLATYRTGRLIVYDKVSEPLRAPFTETRYDASGVGKTVTSRSQPGVIRALGELLSCPICAGTWVAATLVYGLGLVPRATRTFLYLQSAVGIAELLHAAEEAMKWTGQTERATSGLQAKALQQRRAEMSEQD
jgi:hypothetical protein